MNKYYLENIWVNVWVIFIFSLGPAQIISRNLGIDPFIFEKFGSFVITLAFLLITTYKNRLKIYLPNRYMVLTIFTLLLFSILNNSLHKYAPVFFLSFLLITAISIQGMKKEKISQALIDGCIWFRKTLFIFYFILLASLFSGYDPLFSNDGRFTGGFSSPTTFATWVIAIHVISYSDLLLSYNKSKITNIAILFCALLVLVYSSKTRINLAFLLIFIFIFLKSKIIKFEKSRAWLILASAVSIGLIYPIYSNFVYLLPEWLVTIRYDSGEDKSFELREILFNRVYESYINSSFSEILFGLGGESARELIGKEWGMDILPHNDLLRILHDYGIIFSAVFLILVVSFGKRSPLATAISILYIFSFMHNMIYTHYLIATLIITSYGISKKHAYYN